MAFVDQTLVAIMEHVKKQLDVVSLVHVIHTTQDRHATIHYAIQDTAVTMATVAWWVSTGSVHVHQAIPETHVTLLHVLMVYHVLMVVHALMVLDSLSVVTALKVLLVIGVR